MPECFTALDFETANSDRTSICSVGVVRVERGKIVSKIHQLINPCAPFLYWNTKIHGITAADVRDKPTFAQYWDEISGLFGDVVVAHNAAFDISCLKQTVSLYGLNCPNFAYFCTLCISRRNLGLPSNKLDAVARHFELPSFNHHNALADAIACARIFYRLDREFDVSEFRREFCGTASADAGGFGGSFKSRGSLKRPSAEPFDCENSGDPFETRRSSFTQPRSVFGNTGATSGVPNRIGTANLSAAIDRLNGGAASGLRKSGNNAGGAADDSFFDNSTPVDFSKSFLVCGRFTNMTNPQVESVLLRCGASVVRDIEQYPSFVVVGAKRDPSLNDAYPDAAYVAKKARIPVISEARLLSLLPV